jgi:hypothetical protein
MAIDLYKLPALRDPLVIARREFLERRSRLFVVATLLGRSSGIALVLVRRCWSAAASRAQVDIVDRSAAPPGSYPTSWSGRLEADDHGATPRGRRNGADRDQKINGFLTIPENWLDKAAGQTSISATTPRTKVSIRRCALRCST